MKDIKHVMRSADRLTDEQKTDARMSKQNEFLMLWENATQDVRKQVRKILESEVE